MQPICYNQHFRLQFLRYFQNLKRGGVTLNHLVTIYATHKGLHNLKVLPCPVAQFKSATISPIYDPGTFGRREVKFWIQGAQVMLKWVDIFSPSKISQHFSAQGLSSFKNRHIKYPILSISQVRTLVLKSYGRKRFKTWGFICKTLAFRTISCIKWVDIFSPSQISQHRDQILSKTNILECLFYQFHLCTLVLKSYGRKRFKTCCFYKTLLLALFHA